MVETFLCNMNQIKGLHHTPQPKITQDCFNERRLDLDDLQCAPYKPLRSSQHVSKESRNSEKEFIYLLIEVNR